MNLDFDLYSLCARLVVLCTCIPVHEYAHGWMACRLGDPTARDAGRLTLNPLRHFDMLGTLMMVLLGFGWAKPVPVDPRNFRGDPKKGMALTALAGPLANMALALMLLAVYKLLYVVVGGLFGMSLALYVALQILIGMVTTNISLAVFNLIPINPLDGSRIFGLLLPDRAYLFLMRNERIIYLALVLALATGFLSRPLGFLSYQTLRLMDKCTFFIDLIGRLLD